MISIMPATHRRLATAAVLFGLVVAAFEGTVVTTSMPTIARELGGLDAYAWVFSAFLVASTLGVLLCGKLADALGRRPVFIGGMALFLVGSALCGVATSVESLVAFRVIQGLGAGAIQPIAMTLSADMYTLEERARIQGIFTSVWGASSVAGPLLGGLIVTHFSWRWVFLVNVPVGLVAIALLMASYRDPVAPKPVVGMRGALGGGFASVAVLFALEPPAALGAALRVMLAAVAIAALAAFVVHERRTLHPLVSSQALSSRVVRAGLAGGVFSGALLYLCGAYVPLWMTTHAHLGPVAAGAALMPLLVGWSFGSSFGVKVLVRRGLRASAAGGFAIAAAGALLLAFVVLRDLPVGWAFAALGLTGLGIGPAASTSLVATQSSVPWRDRAAVTSAVYATRMLGGSLAVAALGAHDVGPIARFEGIATFAVAAAITLFAIAPRELDRDPGDVSAPISA